VLDKFNETNIAVDITAEYTGGGYTATLCRGVVGRPSFAGAPSWVVLKILWGSGTAVANPGHSALQLAYRKSLATLRWAPVARPACPPTLVYVNESLFPLLPASWALVGSYNIMTFTMRVFSGWPEDYVPATLAPTVPPQSLSLRRTSFSSAGLYSVYLGNLLQFSDAVLDFSLNVIFGVYASGSSFTALCGGGYTPLGSLPAARYVELKPLNGLGDIIIRDQYGAILARYGCRYTATPQYVGFRGGLLRVYLVEAWG